MDETTWLTAVRPMPMFATLRRLHTRLNRPISGRKLRFYSLSCCRAAWPAMVDERSRRAVEVAERALVGMATEVELADATQEALVARDESCTTYANAHSTANLAARTVASVAAIGLNPGYSGSLVAKVRDALAFHGVIRGKEGVVTLLATLADALRDIFGNPFRPVSLDPAWLSSDVVALARGIYKEKAFDRMPILADALQDAGCDSEDVLNHCRDAALAHVRGCWVVDLLLTRVVPTDPQSV